MCFFSVPAYRSEFSCNVSIFDKVKRLHLRVEPCYGFWRPKRYRLGEAMHCYWLPFVYMPRDEHSENFQRSLPIFTPHILTLDVPSPLDGITKRNFSQPLTRNLSYCLFREYTSPSCWIYVFLSVRHDDFNRKLRKCRLKQSPFGSAPVESRFFDLPNIFSTTQSNILLMIFSPLLQCLVNQLEAYAYAVLFDTCLCIPSRCLCQNLFVLA